VFVHASVFDEFARRLVARLGGLKIGDPLDPATDIGPMVEESEAARVDAWVKEAVREGARVLTGGRRIGRAMYEPTVLVDVPETCRVSSEEVFAPLVGLYRFEDLRDAIARVNSTRYGLQAGLFTKDLNRALTAFEELDAGGVVVNDVPTYRIDHMPYGGTKDSGLGRERPRYALEEMTEIKLLVINREGKWGREGE
jgi:glyceraldehyde-3-phosphate dehydrogenase (NADP+)